MDVPQNIPVDRALRNFIGSLATAFEANGVSAFSEGGALLQGAGIRARLIDNGSLDFERNFAGFNWRFQLSVQQLVAVASGKIAEISMQRQPAASIDGLSSDLGESASIADSLLAAVGFGEGPNEQTEVLLAAPPSGQAGSKVDFLPGDAGDLPDLDDSEVTREEVDDLLNHPEVLKLLDMMGIDPNAPSPGDESGLEPELEDRTEVDLRVPEMENDLADSIDGESVETEETEISDGEPDGLQQSAQFLVLMVDAEKLELDDNADLVELAKRLIPILDDEEGSDRERAAKLIDWLLDQPEVEDIFISDDEMTRILKAW